MERATRAPYLAICTITRTSAEELAQVLSGYAHPGAPIMVVETMGFADDEFRARNRLTHPAMAVAGAPR